VGHTLYDLDLTPPSSKLKDAMKAARTQKKLALSLKEPLLGVLKDRFEKNPHRHQGIEWAKVKTKLDRAPEKLYSLHEMENTGGEPDVTGFDKTTGEYLFVDCSAESPKRRRSLCYDPEVLATRKEHKPKNSALGLAAEMGIELLTEEQYRELQALEAFDLKTSSWLKTPPEVRKLGGAIFGDRRFDRVFIYHNGAESYYGARAFRGILRV